MQSIPLKVSHLKAAQICAADKDIRYYLNGVCVEIRPRDALLVSTDGHRLCVIRAHVVPEGEPDLEPMQIIIPCESLKGIKLARGAAACVFEYDSANPSAECKLSGLADGGRTFAPIDGKFPNWLRIVPDKLDGARAIFNPHLVAKFLDVARLVSGNDNLHNINLYENGNSAAVVTCDSAPEFLGLLMPMLWENSPYVRPDWIDGPQSLKQALAA